MKRVSINFDYMHYYFLLLLTVLFIGFEVQAQNVLPSGEKLGTIKAPTKIHEVKNMNKPTTSIQTAILAGGCFWGVEELFRNLPGVVSTEVGYTGGVVPNPTYEIVKRGTSGHAESIKIEFDSSKLSYEDLLKFFFKIHDPTTKNQQGNDIGSQYRSAIFFESEEQHKSAQKIKELVESSGAWKKPLVTEIVKASTFYSAESFHQDYLKKNPGGYTCHYIRDLKF